MRRASLTGACIVCLGLTTACGGGNDESAIAEKEPEVSGRGSDAPALITATGCLTASGDEFVLTDLQSAGAGSAAGGEQGAGTSGAAQPTTESYQLIGTEEELRSLVGREVTVTGPAEPPKVAEVRETTPATEPGNATGTAGPPEPAKPGEPQVATTTETRLEVTQLRVNSITDTGQACATTGREQPR